MKQLQSTGNGGVRWRDVPEPTLVSPADALVRPIAVAHCDGDCLHTRPKILSALRWGHRLRQLSPAAYQLFGDPPFCNPTPLGHEGVAEVLECGSDVTTHRPGDLVVVPFAVSCGSCPRCCNGYTSHCLQAAAASGTPGPLSAYSFSAPLGGLLSDCVRVPFADHMLLPVPPGIDPLAVASASDNIPDAYRAVAPHLRSRPGSPVVIIGGAAASIGLYAVAMARALGSERVFYIDRNRERLRIAEDLGASVVELPRRRSPWPHSASDLGIEAPISVDASVHAKGLRLALDCLSPNGTCTTVGYHFRTTTPVDLMTMYARSTTLVTGVTLARALLPEVLSLVSQRSIEPQRITTSVVDWDDAAEAFVQPATKLIIRRPPLTS